MTSLIQKLLPDFLEKENTIGNSLKIGVAFSYSKVGTKVEVRHTKICSVVKLNL